MIVSMNKVSIIVQEKDASITVKDLRKLSVLHVEHQQKPENKDITSLGEDINLINNCLEVFSQAGLALSQASTAVQLDEEWQEHAKAVIDSWKEHEQLDSSCRSRVAAINEWQKWGDFDPREVEKLEQKGIYLRLFQVPLKQLQDFPDFVVVKNIFTSGGVANCLTISREKFEVVFKDLPWPKEGALALKNKLSESRLRMQVIKDEILKNSNLQRGLIQIKKEKEKEIEFQQALSGMGKEGQVTYITGYVPVDKQGELLKEAKQKKWGIVINPPGEEDNVPTFIRNPRWISLVSPVFKLLEVVPGYRELDISLPFLIFFSIFFGMLIGDAGYGLIYFLITLFVHKKSGRKIVDKSPFFLFYILSFCAIIWGLLTGVFFGQEWFLKIGYKPLAPGLNEVKGIQTFCFFLGAVHLTIAHVWRAILKIPSLTALSDIGWIGVLWTAFLLARTLILGDPFPLFGKWIIITGLVLVVFFTNPQKNILKAVGEGLGTLALSLMNNFTDVVSYVRLFAVGLAGVAIADTFNSMAAGVGTGNIVALVLSAFILLAGHGLNLVLGPMSVLVHGVRLNVLEFSGHANITWSGVAYKPLKE